jgi:hypothetical protein
MKSETKAIPRGLALLCACLPLFGWWMTGPFDIDEDFYGAGVAEMNRRYGLHPLVNLPKTFPFNTSLQIRVEKLP